MPSGNGSALAGAGFLDQGGVGSYPRPVNQAQARPRRPSSLTGARREVFQVAVQDAAEPGEGSFADEEPRPWTRPAAGGVRVAVKRSMYR